MRGRDGQTPRTSMTHTIKVFEKRRLIVLKSNPDDGRSKQASITDAGRNLIETTNKDLAMAYPKFKQDLDMQSLGQIKPAISALGSYLDNQRDTDIDNR
jgi:DNA-binding MarR family transcriptional regulator